MLWLFLGWCSGFVFFGKFCGFWPAFGRAEDAMLENCKRVQKSGKEQKGQKRVSGGEYLSGQRGQTVNLVAYAFTGSNPVSPSFCK